MLIVGCFLSPTPGASFPAINSLLIFINWTASGWGGGTQRINHQEAGEKYLPVIRKRGREFLTYLPAVVDSLGSSGESMCFQHGKQHHRHGELLLFLLGARKKICL